MGGFFQNNPGLVIVSVIMLVAALVLAAIGSSMRNAGMSLRPIVFIAVFFAIIIVPQLLGQAAMAVRPKAKPALDEQAIAGVHAFATPGLIFGAMDDARLQDARPVLADALSAAEDLQTMTGQLIGVVTDAGWSGQPLLFDAPGPLAWFAS